MATTEQIESAIAILFPFLDLSDSQVQHFTSTVRGFETIMEAESIIPQVSDVQSLVSVYNSLIYLHNNLVAEVNRINGTSFNIYHPHLFSEPSELVGRVKLLIDHIKALRLRLSQISKPVDASIAAEINTDLLEIYGEPDGSTE